MTFSINDLLWLLPILLILIVLFRISASGGNNTLKYFFLIGGLGIVIFFIYNGSLEKPIIAKPCPTTISPDELATMAFKDINTVAGMFYEHNFGYDEGETEYLFGRKEVGTFSKYDLENRSKYLIEWCFVEKDSIARIGYIIQNKEKYNEFFEYLSQDGGERILNENYSNFIELVGKDCNAYKYNDCLFSDKGFYPKIRGYLITVHRFKFFKEK